MQNPIPRAASSGQRKRHFARPSLLREAEAGSAPERHNTIRMRYRATTYTLEELTKAAVRAHTSAAREHGAA